MNQNKGPVRVVLNCGANPGTDEHEIDRAEWEAMTPAERASLLDTLADNHMANQGGYGWGIEDPDDEAMVSPAPPQEHLRTLAERLADRAWMLPALDKLSDVAASELADVIRIAQKALGRS